MRKSNKLVKTKTKTVHSKFKWKKVTTTVKRHKLVKKSHKKWQISKKMSQKVTNYWKKSKTWEKKVKKVTNYWKKDKNINFSDKKEQTSVRKT